jgi:hypothetical protein
VGKRSVPLEGDAMIGLLLGWGLPKWGAKLVAYVGVPALIIGAIWFYGHTRHNAGYAQAEIDQAARIAADKQAQTERERTADEALRRQQAKDSEAAQQRAQEIDDATRNIPDQAPSTRQRTRACLGLRAEAKTAGRPEPAC